MKNTQWKRLTIMQRYFTGKKVSQVKNFLKGKMGDQSGNLEKQTEGVENASSNCLILVSEINMRNIKY